jgi:hypothetical protein
MGKEPKAMPRSQFLLLSLLGLSIGAPFAPQALAQESGSTQITVTGTAPKVCVLPAPVTTGTATNATFASNAINITQFVDPNTALVTPSSLSLQFPNTLCNYSANVSLKSQNGGLISSNGMTVASGSGAFLQNVPYTANLSWGSFNLALDTTSAHSTVVSNPTSGATAGNLTLTIATQASSLPVVQGTYQDTLMLKIGAVM